MQSRAIRKTKQAILKIERTWVNISRSVCVLGLSLFFIATPAFSEEFSRPKKLDNILDGVELYENEGHTHMAEGARSFYKTDPPTSGAHDPRWLPPSVYKLSETSPELLVHNLEHGNIVIYFDETQLSESDIGWLKDLTKKYVGQWDGVLMVTRDDKAHPIVLTAWRAIFRLKGLDQERTLAFLDAFRGRGPEHAVR